MEEGLKIRVASDTREFEKGVKDAVKEVKKELQTLNDEEILTPESIERQVKEREKRFDKWVKHTVDRWNKNGVDITEEKLRKEFEKPQRALDGGRTWKWFTDVDTKEYLAGPVQLEKQLNDKILEQKKEVMEIEKAITKETEKQAENIEESSDERKKSSNKFLDSLKSSGTKIMNKVGETGSFVAAFGKAVILGTAFKVLMELLERLVYAIAGLLNNAFADIKKKNDEIFTKIQVVKAMIDSIVETIKPILTSILQTALNAIIEAFRFVQHVVYYLTGINIFAFTGQKLAENMKEAAKSAGEMRKQLMGFDEANVISETGSTSSLGNLNDELKNSLLEGLTIDEHYFDKIKKAWNDFIDSVKNNKIDFTKFGPWAGLVSAITKIFGDVLEIIDKVFGIIGGWSKILTGLITDDWDLVFKGIKEVWDNVIGLLINAGKLILDLVLTPIKGIISAVQWLWDKAGSLIDYVVDKMKNSGNPVLEWIANTIEKIKDTCKTIRDKAQEFFDKIKRAFDDGLGKTIAWIADRINDIKRFMNEHFGTTFDIKVNADTTNAQNKVNTLLKSLTTGGLLTGGGVSVSNSAFSSAWSGIKRLIGLDSGGLVLPQPGHGVSIGSAIMSERRAEAVIPFENPTAMEKIGEAIGKYVNIAIDNRMVVDGRVLASATNNQISKERFLMNR